jgi:hypothetical protein
VGRVLVIDILGPATNSRSHVIVGVDTLPADTHPSALINLHQVWTILRCPRSANAWTTPAPMISIARVLVIDILGPATNSRSHVIVGVDTLPADTQETSGKPRSERLSCGCHSNFWILARLLPLHRRPHARPARCRAGGPSIGYRYTWSSHEQQEPCHRRC